MTNKRCILDAKEYGIELKLDDQKETKAISSFIKLGQIKINKINDSFEITADNIVTFEKHLDQK
jgi:hypothetical protein